MELENYNEQNEQNTNNESPAKRAKNNNILLIIMAAIVIMVTAIIIAFMIPKACTEHIDDNKDNICDVCDATIVPETGDTNPDNSEDNPSEPPTPVIDYTTDVGNAVTLLNKLMCHDVDNLPLGLKIVATLNNISMSGTLAEELFENELRNISIDDNKILIYSVDAENNSITNYIWMADNGIYTVTFDGTEYTTDFRELSGDSVSVSLLPKLTEEDVTFDASTGYFVISSAYLEGLKSEDVEEDTLGLNDLAYSAKFKINENNEIYDFVMKGTLVDEDISTDVLSISYKVGEKSTKFSVTFNRTFTIRFVTEYTPTTESSGTLTVSGSFTPPFGITLIPAQDFEFSADVITNGNTVTFPKPVWDRIEQEQNAQNNDLAEKYAGEYELVAEDWCNYIVVYDDEYKVYVLFECIEAIWGSGAKYVYSDVRSQTNDNYCLAIIQNRMLVVTEHSFEERLEATIETKYDGVYTIDGNGCKSIVVYDEELNVYVVFEQDFFADDEYVYESYCKDDSCLWGNECFATVNTNESKLNIHEHSSFCEFYSQLINKTFTLNSFPTTVSEVSVYHAESGYYFIFSDWIGSGNFTCSGYSSANFSPIRGTIDLTNCTISPAN